MKATKKAKTSKKTKASPCPAIPSWLTEPEDNDFWGFDDAGTLKHQERDFGFDEPLVTEIEKNLQAEINRLGTELLSETIIKNTAVESNMTLSVLNSDLQDEVEFLTKDLKTAHRQNWLLVALAAAMGLSSFLTALDNYHGVTRPVAQVLDGDLQVGAYVDDACWSVEVK